MNRFHRRHCLTDVLNILNLELTRLYSKHTLLFISLYLHKLVVLTKSDINWAAERNWYLMWWCCYQDTLVKSPTVECKSFVRNVWVGHAVAQYVHVNESGEICLEFEVKHQHAPPPDELFGGGKHNARKCTVEFITKLLPDRWICVSLIAWLIDCNRSFEDTCPRSS